MKPAGILALGALLVVALVSFVFVRIEQGAGGTFVIAQSSAEALTPAGVARVVKDAPESTKGAHGVGAICSPLGSGELHNPWRCSISYASGRTIDYLVQIRLNGSYSGGHQVIHYRGQSASGDAQITGCCIVIP